VNRSLADFDLRAMLGCGIDLRRLGSDAATLEEAAEPIVRYLHDAFRDPSGERECLLARFYVTQSAEVLDPELRTFAERVAGDAAVEPSTPCLVLVASAGRERAWNDRRRSVGHRALPLVSVEMVERAPMIAQLIRAMGLSVENVVAHDRTLMRGMEGKTYDVFFVPEALGSPYIPAQREFVERYGIRSVLGFGGVLATGELYAVILFSRVPIPASTADRFRNVALDVKLAISDSIRGGLFAIGD
jgi:hypothetical protein